MILVAHSYSCLTVFDIRYGGLSDQQESNQQRIRRLADKYWLSEIEVRILANASEEAIDSRGRIHE